MARTAKKTKVKKENKEVSAAIKAFKMSEEVEDFYRFIHENKLRSEAHTLMKVVLANMKAAGKRSKKVLH